MRRVKEGIENLRGQSFLGFALIVSRIAPTSASRSARSVSSSTTRGTVGVGDDDVGPQARHHAQRILDGTARGHREPQLREHRLRLSDDIGVAADDQHERRESRSVIRAPPAALHAPAIWAAAVFEYLCHRGKDNTEGPRGANWAWGMHHDGAWLRSTVERVMASPLWIAAGPTWT
jgi:hypothetical protein